MAVGGVALAESAGFVGTAATVGLAFAGDRRSGFATSVLVIMALSAALAPPAAPAIGVTGLPVTTLLADQMQSGALEGVADAAGMPNLQQLIMD